MRIARFMLIAMSALVSLAAGPSRVEYFSNVRDVEASSANVQNYFVVDSEIWDHARPDLEDLRLYDSTGEVPYALQVEHAASSSQENELKVLNLGKSGASTEFVIDADDIPEYNNLTLSLDATDFITEASVEGADELPSSRWTNLNTGTLFDFSREKLGSNFTLRFSPSRFRYLRIRIRGNVEPRQIKGAAVSLMRQRQARWTKIAASAGEPENIQQTTVRSFKLSKNVPIERIEFVVTPSAVNFRREVEIRDSEDRNVGSGSITRIRMKRGHSLAEKESLVVDLPSGTRSGVFKVIIHNGDDRPLPIEAINLLSLERRVYFTPGSTQPLKLYYGDRKLDAPSYDYAKLFAREENATAATLGPGRHNPQYTGRPDDRPWSERHRWVLWGALIIAVLGLGGVALRSLKAP